MPLCIGRVAAKPSVSSAMPLSGARLLPRNRRAWAAWNAHVPARESGECTVSYCMNLLQGFESPEPFVVTLGRDAEIDPSKVLARMRYEHPVYTRESVAAFGAGALHCADVEALIAAARAAATPNATVLVKGSRFMRMERVVNALLNGAGAAQAAGVH